MPARIGGRMGGRERTGCNGSMDNTGNSKNVAHFYFLLSAFSDNNIISSREAQCVKWDYFDQRSYFDHINIQIL